MNAKMKSCFTPHVLMHSLFGLGVGLILAHFFASLANLWVGLIVVVVATGLDTARKS